MMDMLDYGVQMVSRKSMFTFITIAVICIIIGTLFSHKFLGPVVQSVVSLTSSLRVIPLTVLVVSVHNILIFFAKNVSSLSYSHFFSKKFQHICVSLDVNFNESLTNDIVSFEQLGPGIFHISPQKHKWWVFTRSTSARHS